ncbi:DinB family protein [Actinomadura harenae]|uniref:DinB family protein n=1 Tax=Actinomadura harenae TaxID=2483351 RepID=A0A3M2M0N7_9ACTN|nr:DinB family protein [Actinomadura harenae]RMI42433.1 DinB family protein [Actinomadura harenae]
MTAAPDWDAQAVHAELERVRRDFHQLLDAATGEDLARPTDGTRWTNEQLLFHMLFGYMLLWALLRLLRVFGRMPTGVSRTYGRLLSAATKPFDIVNYLGPCMAVHIYGHRRMGAKMDRVIASLHRRVEKETAAGLAQGMHYPARWDPFFTDYMTVADIYRYPARHYDFHRRQLTLGAGRN